MLVLVLRRAGLTPPPISWLKGRLVAEEAAELAGGVLLLLSRLPVAGMEPGMKGLVIKITTLSLSRHTLVDVRLLGRVAGAGVKTDVAEAVHNHAVDEVDGLASPGEVDLGPVVLARGAVDVTGGRSGLDSSVPEIQLWLTYTIKDNE